MFRVDSVFAEEHADRDWADLAATGSSPGFDAGTVKGAIPTPDGR
jgi:hypothetical protein